MTRFYNGGKGRRSDCGFVSGDVITAEVDRRYGTGVVRFYSNDDAVEAEPLPIAFSEEAAFVVTFGFEGASARIVGFSWDVILPVLRFPDCTHAMRGRYQTREARTDIQLCVRIMALRAKMPEL